MRIGGSSQIVRSLAWRLGRRLYTWGRGDVPNEPSTNGEYWLLEVAARAHGPQEAVLLDVGCNMGDWTAFALSAYAHQEKGSPQRLMGRNPHQA